MRRFRWRAAVGRAGGHDPLLPVVLLNNQSFERPISIRKTTENLYVLQEDRY
jgi:hypothetical protein